MFYFDGSKCEITEFIYDLSINTCRDTEGAKAVYVIKIVQIGV